MLGPTGIDDTFEIGVRTPTSGNFMTFGQTVVLGATFCVVVMGVLEKDFLADGLDEYVAPGTAVTTDWWQKQGNGTIVDSGTIAGLLWDPTGGAYQLVQLMLQRLASGDLAAILAAVRKTYHTP